MRATPFWLPEVILCAVAAAGSGLLYGHFFAGTGYLPLVCAAAAAGTAAAAVAGSRTWGTYRTLLTAMGGFAILAVYGIFRDTTEHLLPTRRTAAELSAGVTDGWARMLMAAPPADPRADLLCTPVLITWVAAFTATTLVLRTRTVFAPVVPTVTAFIAALLFVGRHSHIHVVATSVFLVATLSLVLLRTNRAGGGSRRVTTSRLVFGGPAVVVVALLGVLGGLALPLASGEQRFDPRTLLTPPVRVTDTLTPLAGLKRQLSQEPPRSLFTVDIAGDTKVDRIGVAVLDEYDGVSWTSTDRFLVAGRQLADDQAATRSRPLTARIAVEDLAAPFLPAIGWPTRIDIGHTVGFSTTSGVLVSTRPTLRGVTYDLAGTVSERDDGMARAAPSTSPAYRRYTALPDDLSSRLRALARQLTATGTSPYGKLVALEEYLRDLPYRLDAPPGHSYAALLRVLTDDGGGYAEQYAAAFAVLARAAGFPARVAVGYRLGDSPTGTHEVTTRDAHAWAEVHFDGYGWVAFDPTTTADPGEEPDDPLALPAPPTPPAGASPPVPRRSHTAAGPRADRAGTPRGAALVAVVLVTAVLLAAAVPVVKAHRRRRRRHAPGNSARVAGAWREATDRLLERGVPVPVSLTARETADRATGVLGTTAEPLVLLAPLATSAVYAPGEPDDQTVEQAWALEAQLRRGLYPRRFSARKLRAGLDVRPLVTGWRGRTARPEEAG